MRKKPINTASSTEREYEIITHNEGNFKVFLVNLLYRTPHAHQDFEIDVVLHGSVLINLPGDKSYNLKRGDIFVLNPYQSHELTASDPATILSLQIPLSFFSLYYPGIHSLEFTKHVITSETDKKLCATICRILIKIAGIYFDEKEYGILQCAALINGLFYTLFSKLPTRVFSEDEKTDSRLRWQRMRRIVSYIEEHYAEKILLSDIANEENLDLYYLSHLFTETFGIPFQKYIAKLRCERARSLLLLTDRSLLDISISLGFSDPKYFNKSFKELYGCTPKEYRVRFSALDLSEQQISMLTTQEFMSPRSSKVFLAREAPILLKNNLRWANYVH